MKTSFATPSADDQAAAKKPGRDFKRRAVDGVGAGAKKDHWLYVAGGAFFGMVLLAPNLLVIASTSGSDGNTGEGSALRQVVYLATLVISIVAAIRQGNGAKSLRLPWQLLVALGWCWLSIAWAVSPDVAFRRLALTTIVTWNTFIIVQAAGYDRTMTVLRFAFVAVLLGSYAAVALDPSLAVHEMLEGEVNTAVVGNWRGLLGHKNIAGAGCVMTILMFVFDAKQIKSWIRIAVIAAAGYFLYRSQSKTSAGMLAASLVCGWIFLRYDNKYRALLIPLIMVLTAVVLFVTSVYQRVVTESFLNPQAFTGRGYIWDAMLRYSADHLLLGSGFGSFWQIGANSPVFDYAKGFAATVSTGHNGYLDLLVAIGLPGLVLVVVCTIVWPVAKLLTSRILPQRGALAISLLLFGVGHNVTESSLLARDALVSVMMLLAIAFAHNSKMVGERPARKTGSGDVFAALAQRRGEPA